ncbi:unnamed protein product [Symbiodinium natans]|uniref:Uncharacterized protein n=1 Tax=Symbiodinium natans TaxID=878477 RepID=A0A812I802_9DINO|nr:unnamed protein product [Symbiodinium natans]
MPIPMAAALIGPGPLQLRADRGSDDDEMRTAVAAAQEVTSMFGSTPASRPTSETQSHALNLLAPLIRWTGQLLRTEPEEQVPPIHVDEDYRQSLLQLMKLFPYSLQNLALIGAGPTELLQAGFRARDLREAGFAWAALRAAGLSLLELRHAGYQAEDFLAGSVELGEMRALGFSAKELREALPAGPEVPGSLRAAGFSTSQLKVAGFDAWQLEEAGCSVPELLDAGFGAQQMRYTSLSAMGLREAGFGAQELWEAGYTRKQLKLMHFDDEELSAAGIGEQANSPGERSPSPSEASRGVSDTQHDEASQSPVGITARSAAYSEDEASNYDDYSDFETEGESASPHRSDVREESARAPGLQDFAVDGDEEDEYDDEEYEDDAQGDDPTEDPRARSASRSESQQEAAEPPNSTEAAEGSTDFAGASGEDAPQDFLDVRGYVVA